MSVVLPGMASGGVKRFGPVYQCWRWSARDEESLDSARDLVHPAGTRLHKFINSLIPFGPNRRAFSGGWRSAINPQKIALIHWTSDLQRTTGTGRASSTSSYASCGRNPATSCEISRAYTPVCARGALAGAHVDLFRCGIYPYAVRKCGGLQALDWLREEEPGGRNHAVSGQRQGCVTFCRPRRGGERSVRPG